MLVFHLVPSGNIWKISLLSDVYVSNRGLCNSYLYQRHNESKEGATTGSRLHKLQVRWSSQRNKSKEKPMARVLALRMWWRSTTVRWRKKKGMANRECSSLRHVTGNRRRHDGARFIVPLGILPLSPSRKARSLCDADVELTCLYVCMLLSIIPDSNSTRHCYRVIFWKFVRGFCLEMKFVRRICSSIREE